MDWGMPTLLEAADPESAAGLCRELGFDFVELNMNLPAYQQLDIAQLKAIADQYGIYFTIHLDENLDVCDFNQRVADAYLETLLEALSATSELQIPVLNMHLSEGVHFTQPKGKVYLYDQYKEHFFGRLKNAIARCEAAAGTGVHICVENTNGFSQRFLREGLTYLLKSPLFGLTYDIGHDHGVEEIDKPFILAHQDRLMHFHIHDALGRKNHLPLGAGELDIPWYLDLANKNRCRTVLEVKTMQALADSAAWLRERGLFPKK